MIGIVNAAMVAAGEKNERFRLDSSAATAVSFDYFSYFLLIEHLELASRV